MKVSKKKSQTKPLPKVVVIAGPTASGKTALSIKLAQQFNGEIISADSRQIYHGFDIGTAKPSLKERRTVPHYLIDIKNPNQPYTVAQYKRAAIKTIRDIFRRKKLPIIVGGTGLYIKAIVDNLTIPKVKADPLLRRKLEQELQNRGLNFLYHELVKLDPEAAYIVDPKNPRRVIRALEIALGTKKPFSESRRRGKPLFDFLQIGIRHSPEELKKRINHRIDEMVNAGLVDEVKNLIKKYPVGLAPFEAIGYREIISHLQGEISLGEAIQQMKKNTWQFAKRQLTWFRKDKRIHWTKTQKEAEGLIRAFMGCF